MGQGSDTAKAQIVAEVLNIPAEPVTVVHPDTDVTPYDMATLGSRSLFHMGNAVRLAAEDARDKLAALARELGLPEGSNVPVAELFQKKYKMQAGNIIGIGSYIPSYAPPDQRAGQTPEATPFWMVGGAGVEVEVDTETGHVRITQARQRRRRRARRSIRASSRRSSRARPSCSSASPCRRRWSSTPAR